ncbi:hypothetical protein GCM10009731_53170 [Streptomyces globosus]
MKPPSLSAKYTRAPDSPGPKEDFAAAPSYDRRGCGTLPGAPLQRGQQLSRPRVHVERTAGGGAGARQNHRRAGTDQQSAALRQARSGPNAVAAREVSTTSGCPSAVGGRPPSAGPLPGGSSCV